MDGDTKRTYYPDILYRHPFAEEGIETVSIVRRPDEMKQMIRMDASVNGGQKSGSSLKISLCDMEAVGVYQAAVRFVGQHQMAFLKVVSDAGVDKRMTAEDLQHFFADSAEKICTWIEDVRTLSRSWKVEKVGAKEQEILQLLCDRTTCFRDDAFTDGTIAAILYTGKYSVRGNDPWRSGRANALLS